MAFIPVVDLFAGPGGLGEGFSAFRDDNGEEIFKIALSVEKNFHAHKTLELRSFFRKFPRDKAPSDYYDYIKEKSHTTNPEEHERLRNKLFDKYPVEAENARNEAWCAELGKEGLNDLIDNRIREILASQYIPCWGIIGGPPCQAYSVIGRARNGAIAGYSSENDRRSHLYKEYLRVIAQHKPDFFIMENVKGMLSAKLKGELLFKKMLEDLRFPRRQLQQNSQDDSDELEYEIYSLSCKNINPAKPSDYLIEAEAYGIPQTRHRVILLGVNKKFKQEQPKLLQKKGAPVFVKDVLGNLPKLRSGLSKEKKENNTYDYWSNHIKAIMNFDWFWEENRTAICEEMEYVISSMEPPSADLGGEFIHYNVRNFSPIDLGGRANVLKDWYLEMSDWYLDRQLEGVCNHTSRSHMASDLHRYLFAATFAEINKQSPLIYDFPEKLLPNHKNAKSGHFDDRFRVQVANRPSSTITSHISKDGHYFIHYDPEQCRSLTVREAARLQTFPDNYYFEGPRTEQYTQVGNAVPPLLAKQIAEVVYDLLKRINGAGIN